MTVRSIIKVYNATPYFLDPDSEVLYSNVPRLGGQPNKGFLSVSFLCKFDIYFININGVKGKLILAQSVEYHCRIVFFLCLSLQLLKFKSFEHQKAKL